MIGASIFTVDSYSKPIGSPFFLLIEKNLKIEVIRDIILEKLISSKVLYKPYKHINSNDERIEEVTAEEKERYELNYVEFKSTRRGGTSYSFSLKEVDEKEHYLNLKSSGST